MRAAFITGGSSGIGLAAASALAQEGHDLALFARDAAKLLAAREMILEVSPARRVETYAVDVANTDALNAALTEALGKLGAPAFAIASAGIAEPGLFSEQPLDLHRRHMAINYMGSLAFVHQLAPAMAQAGGGHIGLISSGAAFFGIFGYSAYAPSKFALRGLADILHLELAPQNISVTLITPPDTDTPQLAQEKRTKPHITQQITEGGGLWQPEAIADRLLSAMKARKPIATPGLQMTLLHHLGSLIAPVLRWHQKRLIARHIAK